MEIRDERIIGIWQVGGCVRDRIIGIPSKDIDYSVEVQADSVEEGYAIMRAYIVSIGGHIFVESPEHVTIRARVGREAADYVLCRRDGEYGDGRRPDEVFIGSLMDDLSRRDFTMNAIAMAADGEMIDPFGGVADIEAGVIRCVGSTQDRMQEDYLRLLRAARFSITKGFRIDSEIEDMFDSEEITSRLRDSISQDRIRDEVAKMFRSDSIAAIAFFGQHPSMAQACFSGGIWFIPTSEKR